MLGNVWKSLKNGITFKSCVNKMLKIKSLEKKILLYLLEHGRQPTVEVAKKTGATRQTVAKKLENMHDSGLVSSYAPKLKPEKFGLTSQAYIFMREDTRSDSRRKNEEFIKSLTQVSEFHRIFGKYDSIVKVLVKDNKELTDLVNELHDLDGIKETETFIVHSTLKNKPEDPFKRILAES